MRGRKSVLSVLFFSIALWAFLFVVLYMAVPYTMKSWESDSLFVDTPDYWQRIKEMPLYGWVVVKNFLLQFFYYKAAGPCLVSLGVAVLYFFLNCIAGRRAVGIYVTLFVFVAGSLFIVLKKDVRECERWAHLEYAAEKHVWNDVLEIASPAATLEDRDMLPYALLALAVKGELPERMLDYPVQSAEDFDMVSKVHDKRFYKFRITLYDCLGCPNEAIHNVFQLSTTLPMGMSFVALRRLIAYYKVLHNDELADKYSFVMAQSTIYSYKKKGCILRTDTLRRNESGDAPLITESMGRNIGKMLDCGFVSDGLIQYFLCVMLAERNLAAFIPVLTKVLPLLEGSLPVLYQEALLVYSSQDPSFDVAGFTISEEVKTSYDQYRKGMTDGTKHYWTYYAQSQ